MNLFNEKNTSFLYEYLNNASPTGAEKSGQKIWSSFIKPFVDEIHLDIYGTCYGVVNPGKEFKVVLESHADEISWFINHISDDGFLRVIRNGGSDHAIAPAKRVNIHTPKGIVKGVFGWPAIHTRRGTKAKLSASLENIFIDVGAKNKKEVEKMGIHVGCIATFEDEITEINKKYFAGRSLDNKMGGFVLAQVAQYLKNEKIELPYSLYLVNSVQEEVGLRGAEMIAQTIRPNVAIVTDVTHDTHTPLVEPKVHGQVKCGDGPTVTYAPAVHSKLIDLACKTAEENKIPYQREASSRSTGTDTDAFAYSNGGTPSILLSLPLRYMHTTVEMAHKDDIENLVKWIIACLKELDPKTDFRYFVP
ncbi:MAG: M42 family peptidase [Saprospirales bacterium]|nr:MAG: M42 family peptidase [Saprospirales bacterium]